MKENELLGEIQGGAYFEDLRAQFDISDILLREALWRYWRMGVIDAQRDEGDIHYQLTELGQRGLELVESI